MKTDIWTRSRTCELQKRVLHSATPFRKHQSIINQNTTNNFTQHLFNIDYVLCGFAYTKSKHSAASRRSSLIANYCRLSSPNKTSGTHNSHLLYVVGPISTSDLSSMPSQLSVHVATARRAQIRNTHAPLPHALKSRQTCLHASTPTRRCCTFL
jgi:hypothetical protein